MQTLFECKVLVALQDIKETFKGITDAETLSPEDQNLMLVCNLYACVNVSQPLTCYHLVLPAFHLASVEQDDLPVWL